MPMMNKNILQFVAIAALAVMVQSCSSDYAKNMHYIPKDVLEGEELYLQAKPQMQKTSNFGAIKLQRSEKEEDASLFVLQRRNGVYQAETMMHSNDDKRYYFRFGVDYRTRSPAVGFRVEF